MQTTESVIHVMQTLGEKGTPLTRVYRQLYNENLYISAYSRLYTNHGALTPGVTAETVDGTSLAKIRGIIAKMERESYRWSPVRRHYITRKDGRNRPLGLPTWSDKLVEEVIRLMLEAYYEPIFSQNSHGYRPHRGCHTALQQIVSQWTGTVWFIEGDIHGCYDHINHDVLMTLLRRRIQDERLLRLIHHRLESGILEDWQYQRTYSGVPQGSVLSPLLANIYLHELDRFIEEELLPQWNHGDRRGPNTAYLTVCSRRERAKHRGDQEAYRTYTKQMRQLPSRNMHDPHYRRLRYVRYADDFLLGFIGTKAEATEILRTIEEFLEQRLGFQISRSKSKVTHAKSELAHFLGYGIGVYGNVTDKITQARRSANGRVMLRLPAGYVEAQSRQWVRHGHPRIEGNALAYSVEEALAYYQTRYQGIVNYYQYAVDVHELARLKYAMEQSLVHTLASKLKISVSQVYRKLRTTKLVNGTSYKVLQSTITNEAGKRISFTWGGIPLKRRYIVSEPLHDTIQYGYHGSSELVARLLAEECELCGKVTHELEGHHVNRVGALAQQWKGKGAMPHWVYVMTTRKRKTLFVCRQCHHTIHSKASKD